VQLRADVCYRALSTRDARFDGRFFTAVRTTGVYCRPVCPARTPRRENCIFLPCAAAAEAAGFRPCRRCRPETAPGTPAWLGTSATVSRALRLIADGALDGGGVDRLAERLGIGERHLRRLFALHLGASPLAIAQTRRTHFAARLLEETDWPVSRIAFAAGFSSVRRFNEAMRQAFRCAPSDLRRPRAPRGPAAEPTIRLPYRPPFDFDALCGYLASRAVPGVETVDDRGVRRALCIGGRALEVAVRADGDRALEVSVRGGEPADWLAVAERVRTVFDLGADPSEIGSHLRRDAALRSALRRHPGIRVPGCWEPFEMAVRVVVGQQVTVSGATRLAGRIARRFGTPLPSDLAANGPGAPEVLFPPPERLADVPLEEVGLTRQRAGAVRALAGAVASGRLDLAPGADPEAARESLLALPGVGLWTAELVLLRALHEPDAFPAGDLGLRRSLGVDAEALERRAERWRPWRAYGAMLLWQELAVSPGPAVSLRRAAALR